MAISYQMPIWPHWLWNTGLHCAPQTVILRGFAVCVGLTRFPHSETGKRPKFAWLTDKNTFIGARAVQPARPSKVIGEQRTRLASCEASRGYPRSHRVG